MFRMVSLTQSVRKFRMCERDRCFEILWFSYRFLRVSHYYLCVHWNNLFFCLATYCICDCFFINIFPLSLKGKKFIPQSHLVIFWPKFFVKMSNAIIYVLRHRKNNELRSSLYISVWHMSTNIKFEERC